MDESHFESTIIPKNTTPCYHEEEKLQYLHYFLKIFNGFFFEVMVDITTEDEERSVNIERPQQQMVPSTWVNK